MDEKKINKLREIRNLVSDEFEKYTTGDKPPETVLNFVEQLLERNERKNGYKKRIEINARLKFNTHKHTLTSKVPNINNASSIFQKNHSKS